MRKVLKEAKALFKEKGFRGVAKRYGWKFFVAFFCYYLLRDLTIYVFIPYLVTKGLLTGG